MLKKDYSVFKILSYTLLLFSALILTSYPKSYPRYIDSDNFDINFYSLYKGQSYVEIVPKDSSSTLVHLKFSFNRNKVVTDASKDMHIKDMYIINLPEGCYFKENGIIGARGGVVKDNTITYSSTEAGNNNIVEYFCNVTFDEYDILNQITVDVEEKVLEEDTFLYKKFVALEDLIKEEYYDIIGYVEPTTPEPAEPTTPEPSEPVEPTPSEPSEPTPSEPAEPTPSEPEDVKTYEPLIVPDNFVTDIPNHEFDRINQEFDQWINEIDENAGEIVPLQDDPIIKYVGNYCKNKDGIYTNVTTCNIPGIKIEHKDGNYIFTILDNFIGYVRTYNGKVMFNSKNLYFTTNTKEEIEAAYTYYFENYYETQNASAILNYIKERGGVDAFISGNIPGLNLLDTSGINETAKIIEIDNIMSFVSSNDNSFEINFDLISNMKINFNSYISAYNEKIISAAAKNLILVPDNNLYNKSVIKNNKSVGSSAAKSFNDYFILFDPTNKHYLLMNIFSIVQSNQEKTYNTVVISKLNVPSNDFKISFVNDATDESLLKISMSYSDKNKIREVIDYLDTYFKVTSNVNLDAIQPDEAKNINVTYNVVKNIIK